MMCLGVMIFFVNKYSLLDSSLYLPRKALPWRKLGTSIPAIDKTVGAKSIKLKTVPVYIINVKDDEQMLKLALIENIQRQNLSSMEEAEAYALLRGKYDLSESQIIFLGIRF